jgi:hypothetical protein
MATTQSDLENWFMYHPPRPNQVQRYEEIRSAAKSFAQLICASTPDGTERDQSIDCLRDSVMWANAGIACNELSETT